MIKLGQQLPNPEEGWIRIDDTNRGVKVFGSSWEKKQEDASDWTFINSIYNKTITCTTNSVHNDETYVVFTFYDTKLRILGYKGNDHSNNIEVEINGVKEIHRVSFEVPKLNKVIDVGTIKKE